jgi:hypothetical protein
MAEPPGQIEVSRGSAADLPLLEPLWVSVHHQHAESMPELAPYVDDERTWAERGALYAELLAKPDTILLVARSATGLVGYGLAHVMAAAGTWTADTWQTGGAARRDRIPSRPARLPGAWHRQPAAGRARGRAGRDGRP